MGYSITNKVDFSSITPLNYPEVGSFIVGIDIDNRLKQMDSNGLIESVGITGDTGSPGTNGTDGIDATIITGGTANDNAGTATFFDNSGGTFTVTGFTSASGVTGEYNIIAEFLETDDISPSEINWSFPGLKKIISGGVFLGGSFITETISFPDLEFIDIPEEGFYIEFAPKLTSISMPKLTKVVGDFYIDEFIGKYQNFSIDLGALEEVIGGTFAIAEGVLIESINLSSFTRTHLFGLAYNPFLEEIIIGNQLNSPQVIVFANALSVDNVDDILNKIDVNGLSTGNTSWYTFDYMYGGNGFSVGQIIEGATSGDTAEVFINNGSNLTVEILTGSFNNGDYFGSNVGTNAVITSPPAQVPLTLLLDQFLFKSVIDYNTLTNGKFSITEGVSGMPSADSGQIITDDGSQMMVFGGSGTFQVGDTITGNNGATAVITAVTNTTIGNASPSAAGLVSKANLEAKGWTVLVN